MDYIGATPQVNPLMGLLAERLKQAQQFAAKPFGYSNPPAEAILNLLGIPAVQQTAERLAYGEPLTTGRGMTTQIRPEAVEAALTVAPAVGLLGKGTEKAAMAAGRAGERYAEKVVPQIMERGGLPAQLLGDLSQGSIRPMDVWHGSPHGPFTKFDPTKIGSGEGAQAFSYGHYLGEARGTGETYRNQLVRAEKEQINKLLQSEDMASQIAGNTLNEYKNPSSAIGALKSSLTPSTTDIARTETNKAIKMLEDVNKEAGYLYKVDLPDEAIANMLDWDKPVSKQPNVMKALRSEAEQRVRDRKLGDIENEIRASLPKQDIGDDYLSMFSDANVAANQEVQSKALEKLNKMDLTSLVDKELDTMKPVDKNWNMTGKEFYELLATREGSPEKASGLLQRQGVPGTRYLDAGSRNPGGSDTSNFVVFPGGEDLLTIKEINDKPVGGLLGQAKSAEPTDLLSYRGSHTAPGPDYGAPLHDLTGGGQMYPADVYSPKAAQYYGTGYPKADKEAFALANKVRGNPDAEVTMYRAVPKNESIKDINAGDWVTLSKDYAKTHGESVLDNDYKILSKKVKAKDLWTNADSIHEFGYWPE